MTRKIIFIGIILVAFNADFIEAQNPCAWVVSGNVPHPDPTRCNEYYSCTLFIGSLRNCAADQIFDAELRTCVPGDPSTCLPTEIPTTTEILTTTTEILTTTELNLAEICYDVFFGARPHPSSNTLFIGCIRGDGMIMACLAGEIFDSNLLKCVLVPDVCEVPIDICADTRLEVAANPCHCYRFFVCYLGEIKEERECGFGLIYDEIKNECVPGSRETCDLYPGVTEPSSTQSISPTFTQTMPTFPTVSTTPVITSSLPSLPTINTTLPSLPTINSTLPSLPTIPSTSTAESTISSTVSTTLPTSSTTPSWSNPCNGVLLGNRPNQDDCTLFYRCVNGVPFPQECPVGMIFSKEQLQCVVGNVSECEQKMMN